MNNEQDIMQAAKYLRAGQRQQARSLLAQLLRDAPESDNVWYLMSFAVDDKERKLEAVERALEINPANELALTRLDLLRSGDAKSSPPSGDGSGAGPEALGATETKLEPKVASAHNGGSGGTRSEAEIEVEELRRIYKVRTGVIRRSTKEVLAVDGISFEVQHGELFGLLGPNGAGKTTTVKMLTTLLMPTSGAARVDGLDVVEDAQQIRHKIGFIFGGERGLYWRLSGYDNLRYFASLYHVEPDVADQRIPRLLDLVGLKQRADEKVEGYSRGMKQRLHVARTLLHDPQILFLDEPTMGLDPVGARRLRSVIRTMQDENKTILLTTHYMFEADALCDRIGVIDNGKIVALDTPAGLKKHVRDLSVIEVEVFGIGEAAVDDIRAAPFVDTVAVEDRDHRQYLRVHTPRGSEAVPDLMKMLRSVRVGGVQVREPTLEDAYVRLVSEDEIPV